MFVSFDYRCPRSGKVVSKFIKKIDMDDQTCLCGKRMTRLPAGTRTTFKFADTRSLK